MRLIVLILLIHIPLAAQSSVDSFKTLIKNSQGSEQYFKMLELADIYRKAGNLDSAQILCEKVINYASSNENDTLLAKVGITLGAVYLYRDEFQSAIDLYKKSYDICTKIEHFQYKTRLLIGLAIASGRMGEYPKELEYYNEAIEIFKDHPNKLHEAIVYGNIGEYYYKLGYYETATEYIIKSIHISEEINDIIGIAYMSRLMAQNYSETKNYEKAINFYNKSANLFNNQGHYLDEANTYVELGRLFSEINKLYQAENYIQKAIKIYIKNNNDNWIAEANLVLAELNVKKNKFESALQLANKALEYNKITPLALEKIDNYLILAEIILKLNKPQQANEHLSLAFRYLNNIEGISRWEKYFSLKSDYYKSIGNYQQALKFHKSMLDVKDSIFTKTSMKQLKDMQVKYEVDSKDHQNELLVQQNKIQKLEVEKQVTIRNFTIILAFMLVFLSITLYTKFKTNNKLNNKLKELNNTKDKFFNIISHDLKNPFSTLLGYSDMLISDFDSLTESEKKEQIKQIKISAKRTFNLLENLLNWARTQSEGISIEPKENNLFELVERTVNDIKSIAENKMISISVSVDKDINVICDTDTIMTSIRNIISNSIKFTKRKGEIEITNYSEKDKEVLVIKDNGVGIDFETQESLFKIDKKVTTEGTENESGTGLGLALCKEFIELNKGKIWVESELGLGSKFFISIPRK